MTTLQISPKHFRPWVFGFLIYIQLMTGSRAADTLEETLGICGHTVRFRPDAYQAAFKLVRDYHPIDWDLAEDTAVLPPWPLAKNKVNWESVYGSWKKDNFRMLASLMFSNLPEEKWKDPSRDAKAYGKAVAKEFGPSGRDLVEVVEIGNEPSRYSDEAYERLFVSMAAGIREGDKRLKIATCAARAGESGKYFKSLDIFQRHPDLFDIITLHVYAQTEDWPTWARTYPEDRNTDFLSVVRKTVQWRDEHAPGKPIWVTEYGWDATSRFNERSGTFKDWTGNVSDIAQAAYLVRATVLLMQAGADRAYIYFFDDKDEPKLHGSSGVMRNGQPKMSWFALRQMQEELGDFRLVSVVTGDRDAYVSQWKNAKGEERVLIWRGVEISDRPKVMAFDWPRRPIVTPMQTGDQAPALAEPRKVGVERWEIEVGAVPMYVR